MSRWLTVQGLQGDSEMVVGTERGAVRLPVVDGAFLWPDELGKPHTSFHPASPSPRAHQVLREHERARLEAERTAVEARLAALDQEPLPFEPEVRRPAPAAPDLLSLVRSANGAAAAHQPPSQPKKSAKPRPPGGRVSKGAKPKSKPRGPRK